MVVATLWTFFLAAAPAKDQRLAHVVAANSSSTGVALLAPMQRGGGIGVLQDRINAVYERLDESDKYLDSLISKHEEHVEQVEQTLARINSHLSSNPEQFGDRTGSASGPDTAPGRAPSVLDDDTSWLEEQVSALESDIDAEKTRLGEEQTRDIVDPIYNIDQDMYRARAEKIGKSLKDSVTKPRSGVDAPGQTLAAMFTAAAQFYEQVKAKKLDWVAKAEAHKAAAEANIEKTERFLGMRA